MPRSFSIGQFKDVMPHLLETEPQYADWPVLEDKQFPLVQLDTLKGPDGKLLQTEEEFLAHFTKAFALKQRKQDRPDEEKRYWVAYNGSKCRFKLGGLKGEVGCGGLAIYGMRKEEFDAADNGKVPSIKARVQRGSRSCTIMKAFDAAVRNLLPDIDGEENKWNPILLLGDELNETGGYKYQDGSIRVVAPMMDPYHILQGKGGKWEPHGIVKYCNVEEVTERDASGKIRLRSQYKGADIKTLIKVTVERCDKIIDVENLLNGAEGNLTFTLANPVEKTQKDPVTKKLYTLWSIKPYVDNFTIIRKPVHKTEEEAVQDELMALLGEDFGSDAGSADVGADAGPADAGAGAADAVQADSAADSSEGEGGEDDGTASDAGSESGEEVAAPDDALDSSDEGEAVEMSESEEEEAEEDEEEAEEEPVKMGKRKGKTSKDGKARGSKRRA